ncbi:hypothetical protein [Pikeienuella sp. HZG-20]
MQPCGAEDDKLVETWLSMPPMGAAWPDPVAQARRTDPLPRLRKAA